MGPLSHWSALQRAPPTSYQRSRSDVSGPAQSLVGAAVGPAHKQPTVKERPLVWHSANGWGSGGLQVESEVRDRSWPLWAHLLTRATHWPWPRPWGSSESLPYPCPLIKWQRQSSFGWPEESKGQLGPGNLAPSVSNSWAGSGDLFLREPPTEVLQSEPGPQRGKVVPWDLVLSWQNRE